MIDVKLEIEKFDEEQLRQWSSAIEKAAARSINRTLNSTRSFVQKAMSQKMKLKREATNKRFKVHRADRIETGGKLTFFGEKVPLIQFSAKPKNVKSSRGRRVGATALINGSRQTIPGGFIATMRSGKEGVFARKGDARLPIKELFSNVVADLFRGDPTFMGSVQDFARTTLNKNFLADAAFYLKKEG